MLKQHDGYKTTLHDLNSTRNALKQRVVSGSEVIFIKHLMENLMLRKTLALNYNKTREH